MIRASLALAAAVAMSAANPACSRSAPAATGGDGFRVVTVVEGLDHPWSIAFLPGRDMLVTERPGRLRIVRNGTLLADPVAGVPRVLAQGQGGLMDVVPHPAFATNRLLYLSFSKPGTDGAAATTAVVRGRLQDDRFTGVEEIFVADTRGGGHFGSRLAFDADGFLFITVGDRQAPPQGNLEAHPAQDLSNHHGTIVRVHDDGRVPADNPFVGLAGARPEIWSYGHRNPQGLAIHPETGDVWATEHGPQGGDELNLVQRGRNYGWPVVGYGVNYGGSKIHASTEREGMVGPVHYWVPSIATSGLMIYTGQRFPDWHGNLLAGGLAREQLARLAMNGRRVVSEDTMLRGTGRIRDVRQGPDGYIYVAIDRSGSGPSIVRLEASGG